MKYQKQITLVVGIAAVAVLFFGIRAWQNRALEKASWPALDGGFYEEAVTLDGVTSLVPYNQVYDSGMAKDGIPALTNPDFVSVMASDAQLADDGFGIDVEVNGEHRFYPYQIMNWHEVVNDEFNGMELAVTYCALCGTNAVYDRTLNGSTLQFGVSGQVYNNNTLMYDQATDSRWTQINGLAVTGQMIGQSLTRYPSTVMSWGVWKKAYPAGEVLSLETGYARDYTTHPYASYERQKALYFPINHASSAFGPKWRTTVYEHDGATAVFVTDIIKGMGVQTFTMTNGEQVLGVYDAEQETVHVYANPEGKTFTYDFDAMKVVEKLTLEELPAINGYWFCVAAMYPEEQAAGLADGSGAGSKEELEPLEVELNVGT